MRTIFPVRRHARLHVLCILALSAALLFALADARVTVFSQKRGIMEA